MTLAEIGFSIRNQAKGYFSSDDERIDIEFVYKMVKQVRSTLIKERYKELGAIDELMYQNISCLEIQCEEIICNCVPSGEYQYWIDLPILEDIYGNIKYLGTADMRTKFTEKTFNGFQYITSSPYTGMSPVFTRVQNKAYLKNLPTPDMKFITLVGLLADPLNGGCYLLDENNDFPLSQNMIQQLELICLKQLMSTLQQQPDTKNNASNVDAEDKKS